MLPVYLERLPTPLGIFTNWADGIDLNEHHLQPTSFCLAL